jgi:hypothetical protein
MKKLIRFWQRLSAKTQVVIHLLTVAVLVWLIYMLLGCPPFSAEQAFRRAEKAAMVGPSTILGQFQPEEYPCDGLILGQHVYLEVETEEGEAAGIPVSMAFICYNDDGSAYVWAENGRGKLEMRAVTVGDFNDMMGTVNIIEGLTEEDYIAFPDPELCKEGVPVTHEVIAAEDAVAEGGV